ncbi:uncharacterized aarF domain-containing protein kinase 2-like [Paramacrobiotus metropolitanus]|uniref:uncharacterized aarF domain-containing protein kinase 2-like n=1 Tax=Paramacrobiotus metropolitanus TaxID=2943436 RepID=UPI0024463F51|nr:uncharacterized aarF domain-containing protein kinase 2-like [Paramacrobiotus metropolitanus]
MAFAAVEPFLTASARECKKSLTLINFKRFQACFGWAKTGSSVGYGAWLKYTRIGGKTIKVSMLLGILPVHTSSRLSAVSSLDSLPDAVGKSRVRPEPLPAASTSSHRSNLYIFLRQPWLFIFLFFRCLKLGLLFGPMLILYVFMHDVPQLKLVWLHLLLKAFQTSGPTFMKFGQWMSTRRDIFSPELCAVFSTLHRRTPPHSFHHTERELNRAFGKSWKRNIIFYSKLPVGSGCVGQVYKVKVAANSINVQGPPDSLDDSLGPFDITPVRTPQPEIKPAPKAQYVDAALKVLHPHIEDRVNRDLVIMEIGANILEFMFKDFRWLRLRDSVLAFSSLMQKQLDLRVEAKNLEIFRQNFANFEAVTFPAPHYPFVTKHVLMESWEDGVSISNYLDNKVPHQTKQKLASLGADALLKMTFVDNFVHADMHPGNLFVKSPVSPSDRPDRPKMVLEDIGDLVVVGMRKRALPLQLVIIDAGLTASLSQYDFDSFRGVFAAVVKGDGDLVADKFLFHAAADACSDRVGFRRDMSKLVHEARSRELSLSEVDVGQLLSDLFSILVKYHVKLESNFVSIMLSIMVCEGLARSLDPNLDLLEKARPVLLRKLIF